MTCRSYRDMNAYPQYFLELSRAPDKGQKAAQNCRCHFECKLHMVSVGVPKNQHSPLWEFLTPSVMVLYLITPYILFSSTGIPKDGDPETGRRNRSHILAPQIRAILNSHTTGAHRNSLSPLFIWNVHFEL